MSRIRTVKPEFWQHPKVTSVSRDARLYFLGLLNEVDDLGRVRYGAKRLAGVLFGEDDDVDSDRIVAWTAELEGARLVERYEVEGAQLLVVLGFTEHQRINRPSPSKLPSPPKRLTEGSVRETESLTVGKERKGTRERAAFDEDFSEWWNDYPRKIDRESARKAYAAKRKAGAGREPLLAAVRFYAESVKGKEAAYVKHASTFLNNSWGEWVEGSPEGERPATLEELAVPSLVREPWVCPAGNPECVDGFMDIAGERYAEECECRMKTRSG